MVLEAQAHARVAGEGGDLAQGINHGGPARPALSGVALGVAGKDPDEGCPELLGHLDPLLDLHHLALPNGGVRPAEVVMNPDADDREVEVPGGPAQHLQVGRPGLREVNVLELHPLHQEVGGTAGEEAHLVHGPGIERAIERAADAADSHGVNPFGGVMPLRAWSTCSCKRGLALHTRLYTA